MNIAAEPTKQLTTRQSKRVVILMLVVCFVVAAFAGPVFWIALLPGATLEYVGSERSDFGVIHEFKLRNRSFSAASYHGLSLSAPQLSIEYRDGETWRALESEAPKKGMQNLTVRAWQEVEAIYARVYAPHHQSEVRVGLTLFPAKKRGEEQASQRWTIWSEPIPPAAGSKPQ